LPRTSPGDRRGFLFWTGSQASLGRTLFCEVIAFAEGLSKRQWVEAVGSSFADSIPPLSAVPAGAAISLSGFAEEAHMRMRSLKILSALSGCLLAATASAAAVETAAPKNLWTDADHVDYSFAAGAPTGNLDKAGCMLNHGGPVIVHPKVVLIFWGPSFGPAGADHTYATTLQSFRDFFGTTPEFNIVSLYGVSPGSLVGSQADFFDSSTPPTNVTDAMVQSKVSSYLASHGGNDPSTVYEVFIPSSSYSSVGSSTSCGGPSLTYCAYHAWIGSGTSAVKYSIQPWPGCSGCRVTGWSDVQNAEKLFVHTTRASVTNPTGNGWWDSAGNEIDDKCAWSPAPFIGSGGYSYEYGWSVRVCACIKSIPF
jgi:hypothetical protein